MSASSCDRVSASRHSSSARCQSSISPAAQPAEFSARARPTWSPDVLERLLGPDRVVEGRGHVPRRPADELSAGDLATLHDALHRATKAAIAQGGVHTGEIIGFRVAGRHCPRCGAEMTRGTVAGRTTWWCPVEQI